VAIRADAIADREYQATVSTISLLARVDYSGGWPASKQFDLKNHVHQSRRATPPGDECRGAHRGGTDSGRADCPTKAVFADGGRPVVYRFSGRDFVPVPVEIIRRGRDPNRDQGAGRSRRSCVRWRRRSRRRRVAAS
jgi:hypothetical protein